MAPIAARHGDYSRLWNRGRRWIGSGQVSSLDSEAIKRNQVFPADAVGPQEFKRRVQGHCLELQNPYLATRLFSFLPITAIAACWPGNEKAIWAPVAWSRILMAVPSAESEIST